MPAEPELPGRSRQAERRMAVALAVTVVAALGAAVVYWRGGEPQLEGALLGTALIALGIAVVLWSKYLFPGEPVTAMRPRVASTDEERAEFSATYERGTELFTRRRLLSRLLWAAIGALGLAALFPIRSLGPRPGGALFETAWARGRRLVTPDGEPVRLGDLPIGAAVTVFPEDATENEDAATVLIRVEPELLELPEEREEWAPLGHVAYSKICTHVACPVGLYQEDTHRLLCPCHQSTFDVLRLAEPVFGPATRRLPQLPIAIDDDGVFVALGDYVEPVGPGFTGLEVEP